MNKLFIEIFKDDKDKYWVTEKCWYDFEKPMNGSDAGYGIFDTYELAMNCIKNTKLNSDREIVLIFK